MASVYGKAGRAETATDPAPTEMFETVINLKPKAEWRPGMTIDKPDRGDGQGAAIPRRLQRLDHADQGAHRHALDRHPHARRRQGDRHRSRRDGTLAREIEPVSRTVPGTSSAYAERVIGGYYLDVIPTATRSRATASWCSDVQDVIATALGGANRDDDG